MVEQMSPPPSESNIPVPPPIDDPVVANSSKRKAILATGLVTLMAIGIVWYDPFSIFHYNVELGNNQAAELTPTPATAQGITATCDNSAISIEWDPVPGAELNGINRSVGTEPLKILYLEPRDSNFTQYIHRDTDVQPGGTYSYQVFTAIPGDTRPVVTITCQ